MSIVSTFTLIEIKAYLRNWTAIFWTFAYPIALLIILSLVFGGGSGYTAKVEIRDDANNAYSRAYLEAIQDKVDMVPGLSLNTVFVDANTPAPAQGVIRLHMPAQFGQSTIPAPINVIVEGTLDANTGGFLAMLAEVTEVYNRVQSKSPQRFYLDYSQSQFEQPDDQQYNAFLVSGLTALTVVSTAMFGFTTVLVEMRQNGALKMFQVFPMKKSHFIAGFVLSRALVLSTFCILFFYLSNIILGTNIGLSALHIAGFSWLLLLGIIAFLGMGLMLVSVIKKGASAIAIINMINLPIIFLSDLFIPVASMPEFIRGIAEVSPVYLFVNAMRDVTQSEFVLSDLLTASITLIVAGIITLAVSSKLFQWRTA